MIKYKFGQEYYLTTHRELNEYLEYVINDDKNKQIKYIFTNGPLLWNETNKGNVYELDTEIFIVFNNDSVLKINYLFYSLMYAKYMWIQNLYPNDKKCNNDNFKLEFDIANLRIVGYEIEKFSEEYETNPSEGTVRPEGGDYFKQITLELSNGRKLCICAIDAEVDGYCNIWIE